MKDNLTLMASSYSGNIAKVRFDWRQLLTQQGNIAASLQSFFPQGEEDELNRPSLPIFVDVSWFQI